MEPPITTYITTLFKWLKSFRSIFLFLFPLSLIIHQKVQQWHTEKSTPFPPTPHAAFGPSCWRIWWADVYLPVCACCTGWRIFCTASVDRQTHCNSFSQLVLLLHCCLFVCWTWFSILVWFSSRRDTQSRICRHIDRDKSDFSSIDRNFFLNVGQLNLWLIYCSWGLSLC